MEVILPRASTPRPVACGPGHGISRSAALDLSRTTPGTTLFRVPPVSQGVRAEVLVIERAGSC
jgi:hypothetical protein